LLAPERFSALCRDFPSLELFEWHQDLPRRQGQKPHNRYYLAYESSIYRSSGRESRGVARHGELPAAWQGFLEELEESAEYRSFVERMLGATAFETRYAWHVGVTGSEVSPHVDSAKKLATHIFYFNTPADWEEAWGGQTVILAERRRDVGNPDFADFAREWSVPFLGNRSLLFRNTAEAWHGVRPLRCPEGRHRRLFNVVFEAEGARRAT
jgi:hypothetical protein